MDNIFIIAIARHTINGTMELLKGSI